MSIPIELIMVVGSAFFLFDYLILLCHLWAETILSLLSLTVCILLCLCSSCVKCIKLFCSVLGKRDGVGKTALVAWDFTFYGVQWLQRSITWIRLRLLYFHLFMLVDLMTWWCSVLFWKGSSCVFLSLSGGIMEFLLTLTPPFSILCECDQFKFF